MGREEEEEEEGVRAAAGLQTCSYELAAGGRLKETKAQAPKIYTS